MNFRACAILPVFNHHAVLSGIVDALLATGLPIILVDDGSDSVTKQALAHIAAGHPDVECHVLAHNCGKGAAVIAGLKRAAARGFSHALQIDADGQHDTADVPALLALARRYPGQLISGAPRYDHSVPAVRFYGRYLTHALVWLETLSFTLRDSMCGFRVYPVEPTLALAARIHIGERMDFDTEIMARLYWAGTESRFLPTQVRYPEDGVSHFRMLRDNSRMVWLHLRLIAGMLPRIPGLLGRNRARKRALHWANIGERGSLTGLRFLARMDRMLGRPLTHAVLYPVTAYFFLTQARARCASRAFLLAAGAHPNLWLCFRHFTSFAVSILDKAAAWHNPARLRVSGPEPALLTRVLTSGQGVLLLSAHLGNLDAARALGMQIPGVHINALVYTDHAPRINTLLEHSNAEFRSGLIQVRDIGPDTALLLRTRIAAGESVVIVGDRTPVSAASPVVSAEFLGRPAPFAVGPYVLAHVLECPVYLLFCLREGPSYRFHFELFAERIRLPRARRARAAAEWAGRYARRLEDYARRYPLQWYNFYDFWNGAATAAPTTQVTRDAQARHFSV